MVKKRSEQPNHSPLNTNQAAPPTGAEKPHRPDTHARTVRITPSTTPHLDHRSSGLWQVHPSQSWLETNDRYSAWLSLDGEMPASGGESSLFIDIIDYSATPVPVAGCHHRMRQRGVG